MTQEALLPITQPEGVKPRSPSTQMRQQMTSPISQKEHAERKNVYSRPVIDEELTLYSLQAQQVMQRSFIRVSYSLFSTDVILRLIGDEDQIDDVADIISAMVADAHGELDSVIAQMEEILEVHSGSGKRVSRYSNPVTLKLEITAPQVGQFIDLVSKLDRLVMLIDNLWHKQVLTGKQRTAAQRQWRQHVNRVASKIIQMEGRARGSAMRQGKGDEVTEHAPLMADHAEHDANIAADAGETTEGFPTQENSTSAEENAATA
ncbi:DUF1845 domain-containing protein [Halomonas sp. KO116]|uniref:DUF1845 domain-containing protein n=1 Tax=Halomonas sp. KO116 TaxID=1504981 RepID=UPI0004E445D1|nr:DUF1845 domain-containing protein [Halomonas sp. KO116]AJY53129.1 hypothetical protein KO116_P200022 [Halomonas sp. KO116]